MTTYCVNCDCPKCVKARYNERYYRQNKEKWRPKSECLTIDLFGVSRDEKSQSTS